MSHRGFRAGTLGSGTRAPAPALAHCGCVAWGMLLNLSEPHCTSEVWGKLCMCVCVQTHTWQLFLGNIEMLFSVIFTNFIKILKSTLFSVSLHYDFQEIFLAG